MVNKRTGKELGVLEPGTRGHDSGRFTECLQAEELPEITPELSIGGHRPRVQLFVPAERVVTDVAPVIKLLKIENRT